MNKGSDDKDSDSPARIASQGSAASLLFDSLVHHLVEKGVLTKNDALSVVQTAAEVVRGQLHDSHTPPLHASATLSVLERIYSSFEALESRPVSSKAERQNVHALRPPLHNDRPRFPSDD